MYALQFSGRQSKQDLEKPPIHVPESLVCGSNFSGHAVCKRGVDYCTSCSCWCPNMTMIMRPGRDITTLKT